MTGAGLTSLPTQWDRLLADTFDPSAAAEAMAAKAVIVLVIGALIAGCWSDDPDTAQSPTRTPQATSSARPAAPPPQPSPTAAPGVPDDTVPAYLATLPARKSCGHFRIAPPGGYPRILVEVVKGNVPCREARRVFKTQYRNGTPDQLAEAAAPWRCSGPENSVVCHTDPGPEGNLIRARFH